PSRRVIRPSRFSTVSSGATSTLALTTDRSPRRATDNSGTTSEAGANPSHNVEAPPASVHANPPTATSPDPNGPSTPSLSADAHRPRQRLETSVKRSSPSASSTRTAPSAASAHPSRSGCSRQNHGSPPRRDAATT